MNPKGGLARERRISTPGRVLAIIVPCINPRNGDDLTMKPSQALLTHRDELRRIVEKFGVTRPRVFGSVASGQDDDGSDLDLLVDPSASTTLFTIAALQDEAEQLLGVRVDVLTPKALPRRFRDNVLSQSVPL